MTSANTLPEIPVSIGELMDKWVILKIKFDKISDPVQLKNICDELEALDDIAKPYQYGKDGEAVTVLLAELFDINNVLWIIEDEIRNLEREKIPEKFFIYLDKEGHLDDDEVSKVRRFVELAREVYFTNDKRCAIKRSINELLRSGFIEEKSYKEY